MAKKTEAEPKNRVFKNGEALHQMETAESPAVKVAKPISLPTLDIRTVELKIVGDSELIVHNWSAKAIREMLDKQMGVATAGREKKDPLADFLGSLYVLEQGKVKGTFNPDDYDEDGHPKVVIVGGKFGLPGIAFKKAAVEACTSLGKQAITKVAARQCFHVVGEMVEILGQPRMRQDMVRLNGGTADIRYRGAFREWKARILVRYNARLLTDEQLCNVFNIAGFAVGVGEWRSEKDGSYGLFHVQRGDE